MCEKCEAELEAIKSGRPMSFRDFIKSFHSTKEEKAKEEKPQVEFAIWDEKQASDKPKKVFFKLKEYFGNIVLIACHENGEKIDRGNILAIRNDGTIKIHSGINPSIGLELNEEGQVITE